MIRYLSSFIALFFICMASAAQTDVTEVVFNGGNANGASITFGDGVTATASINGGVVSIDAADITFRVKCKLAAPNPLSADECVVYAGVSGPTLPVDTDGDGYADSVDSCKETPPDERESVDSTGCGPSEVIVNAAYCAETPTNFICEPSNNFGQDFASSPDVKDLQLQSKGVAVPFTLTNSTTARGEFFYVENDTLPLTHAFRAWFSLTPGGEALTTGKLCDFGSREPNGKTTDWSQVGEVGDACFLGQQERVLYANFAVFEIDTGELNYSGSFNIEINKEVFAQ